MTEDCLANLNARMEHNEMACADGRQSCSSRSASIEACSSISSHHSTRSSAASRHAFNGTTCDGTQPKPVCIDSISSRDMGHADKGSLEPVEPEHEVTASGAKLTVEQNTHSSQGNAIGLQRSLDEADICRLVNMDCCHPKAAEAADTAPGLASTASMPASGSAGPAQGPEVSQEDSTSEQVAASGHPGDDDAEHGDEQDGDSMPCIRARSHQQVAAEDDGNAAIRSSAAARHAGFHLVETSAKQGHAADEANDEAASHVAQPACNQVSDDEQVRNRQDMADERLEGAPNGGALPGLIKGAQQPYLRASP